MNLRLPSTSSFVLGMLENRASAAEKQSPTQRLADQVMQGIIDRLGPLPICDLMNGTAIYRTSSAIDGALVVQSITASALYKESA